MTFSSSCEWKLISCKCQQIFELTLSELRTDRYSGKHMKKIHFFFEIFISFCNPSDWSAKGKRLRVANSSDSESSDESDGLSSGLSFPLLLVRVFTLSLLFFPLGEEAMALSASEIHWDSDDEENNEDLLVLHAFFSISFLCFSTFSQIKLSDGKNTFKLPIF